VPRKYLPSPASEAIEILPALRRSPCEDGGVLDDVEDDGGEQQARAGARPTRAVGDGADSREEGRQVARAERIPEPPRRMRRREQVFAQRERDDDALAVRLAQPKGPNNSSHARVNGRGPLHLQRRSGNIPIASCAHSVSSIEGRRSLYGTQDERCGSSTTSLAWITEGELR
jgi:hypothetical protein